MHKRMIWFLLFLLALLPLTGCDKTAENSGYILTDYTALPESITKVSRCFLNGYTLVLCCWEEADKENAVTYAATLHTDGSNFQKLPLELSNAEFLLDIAPDGYNGFWALVVSSNNTDTASYALCRFDSNGKRVAESVLNGLLEETGALRFVGRDLYLCTDGDGNLCVVARDGKTACFLFDEDGRHRFTLKDSSDPQSIIITEDGQFAVCTSNNGGASYSLLTIDMDRQLWDEKIDIGTAANVFSGNDQTAYYLFDSSDFYSCTTDISQRELLFNWSNLGLASGNTHVCPLPDGRFAVVAGTYNQTRLLSYEFCIVTPGKDERTILTMLSLQPEDSLLEAIALFNKSNDEYRVELTSYFPKNENMTAEDWNTAITKLNTQLISGDIPDLMDLNNMPVDAYSRRGILEDLYPYLQNDPEIDIHDYYENVFTALSLDGKLPYVTSSVRILSVFADGDVIGQSRGWTMEEFTALKESQALKMEFFPPTQLLKLILSADNYFVDWESGQCSYDSEEFAKLLELCLRQAMADVEWMNEDGVFTNQANCLYVSLDSLLAVSYYNAMLGGHATPVGIPNSSGEVMHILEPANKIGFSSACKHKDGAWAFVRSFLEPRLQESGWYFPYLKSSFEKINAEALKGNTIWTGGMYGNEANEADIELARELLGSAMYCANRDQELIDMILNMSSSYFAGSEDPMAAAAMIQDRAMLYVGEHS